MRVRRQPDAWSSLAAARASRAIARVAGGRSRCGIASRTSRRRTPDNGLPVGGVGPVTAGRRRRSDCAGASGAAASCCARGLPVGASRLRARRLLTGRRMARTLGEVMNPELFHVALDADGARTSASRCSRSGSALRRSSTGSGNPRRARRTARSRSTRKAVAPRTVRGRRRWCRGPSRKPDPRRTRARAGRGWSRRDDPHVRGDRLVAADALELALLEEPQQLHLNRRRDLADLANAETASPTSRGRPPPVDGARPFASRRRRARTPPRRISCALPRASRRRSTHDERGVAALPLRPPASTSTPNALRARRRGEPGCSVRTS